MNRQVVIYYANETSIGLRRLRRIEARAKKFRECGDEAADAIGTRVISDIERFPRTTFEQVVEIQRVAREHGMSAGLAGAVVFDNESAKCGWFEVQDSGGYRSRKEPFRDVAACHRLLEDSPLAGLSALKAAIGEAAKLYPPRDHEFILVTRSHGADAMAVTLGLPEATLDRVVAATPELERSLGYLVDPDTPEARDLGGMALGVYDPSVNGSEEAGAGKVLPGDDGLGWNLLGWNLLGEAGLGGKGLMLGTPELAEAGVGITKQAFLDALEEAGDDLGVQFSLVFMDSCGSDIPRQLASEVPSNVRMLFGSTEEGLEYDVPDYALLGDGIDVRVGIVAAFERLLERTANVKRFALEREGGRLGVL